MILFIFIRFIAVLLEFARREFWRVDDGSAYLQLRGPQFKGVQTLGERR